MIDSVPRPLATLALRRGLLCGVFKLIALSELLFPYLYESNGELVVVCLVLSYLIGCWGLILRLSRHSFDKC